LIIIDTIKTIRPFALKGHGSIAHEAKPCGLRVLLLSMPFKLSSKNHKFMLGFLPEFHHGRLQFLASASVVHIQFQNEVAVSNKNKYFVYARNRRSAK